MLACFHETQNSAGSFPALGDRGAGLSFKLLLLHEQSGTKLLQ